MLPGQRLRKTPLSRLKQRPRDLVMKKMKQSSMIAVNRMTLKMTVIQSMKIVNQIMTLKERNIGMMKDDDYKRRIRLIMVLIPKKP
jgi:hypothetical protein